VRGSHARVLEIDPVKGVRARHQVAAVEVAMREHARPGRDLRAEPVEPVRQHRAILDGKVAPSIALEEMLPEEMHLPRQLSKSNAIWKQMARCGASSASRWRHDELIERLAIELFAPRGARLLRASCNERSPRSSEGGCRARRRWRGSRHGQAPPRHEVADHDEGQLSGIERLGVERDDGVVVAVDEAVVPPGRRISRERDHAQIADARPVALARKSDTRWSGVGSPGKAGPGAATGGGGGCSGPRRPRRGRVDRLSTRRSELTTSAPRGA